MSKALLFYDEDCGFCRRSVRWVMARAASGVEPVPLRSPRADELLADVAPEARMESWHLVTPDGTVRSAEDVVPHLLRLMPRWRALAAPASRLRIPLRLAYHLVARHRHRLGAGLDEDACDVPRTRPAREER